MSTPYPPVDDLTRVVLIERDDQDMAVVFEYPEDAADAGENEGVNDILDAEIAENCLDSYTLKNDEESRDLFEAAEKIFVY